MDDIYIILWCFILAMFMVIYLKQLWKIENSIRQSTSSTTSFLSRSSSSTSTPSPPSSLDAPPSYAVVMEVEEEALPSYAQVVEEEVEEERKVTVVEGKWRGGPEDLHHGPPEV